MILTPAAVARIKKLTKYRSDVVLLVFLQSGGCGGFMYKYAVETEDEICKDDIIVEQNGVRVIMHLCDEQYFKDVTLDYVTGEMLDERFEVINPNTKMCGCGISYIMYQGE